jgi:hypothetical protein
MRDSAGENGAAQWRSGPKSAIILDSAGTARPAFLVFM